MSPTQLGQTAGSIAGGALAPGVGVPVGALVGTLAGLLVEHKLDLVREDKERTELSNQLTAPDAPQAVSLEQPTGEPTRVWVDEQLLQGRLTAGHFEVRPLH